MKEDKNKKTIELGTKPVGGLLLQYALPAIIAMTASSLYNMVDSIFCEVGSKKSLVDAIRMGIKMPDDKFVAMHENSRKTAIEKFGYRNWASKIEDFLLN